MADTSQISKSLRRWIDITTHRSMSAQVHYVKSQGFSMQQFFMLLNVHYKKQCGISDLSERLDITAAAASQMVEKLVQSGLLERAEDPNDRRAKHVTLSAKGQDLIEKSIHERFRWVDELISGLNTDQRAKVSEALNILMEATVNVEAQQ